MRIFSSITGRGRVVDTGAAAGVVAGTAVGAAAGTAAGVGADAEGGTEVVVGAEAAACGCVVSEAGGTSTFTAEESSNDKS